MHSSATVAAVLKLHEAGLNNCEISRRTGVSRPTIRDWVHGKVLRWTAAFLKSETAAVAIYVSRKADVARLDEFVGPKR